MEPAKGIEPPTYGLRNRCSTPELRRPISPTARFLNRLAYRHLFGAGQFGNIWEQNALQMLDRMAVRLGNRMGVDIERGFDGCMPELLLRHLCRYTQIMEERRVEVPELVPCHAPNSGGFTGGLQEPLQQVSSAEGPAPAIRKNQVVRIEAHRALAVVCEKPGHEWGKGN